MGIKEKNLPSVLRAASNDNIRIVTAGGLSKKISVDDFLMSFDIAETWMGFQNRVDSGNAPYYYPVGTQISGLWSDGSNEYTVPWDIVDYDSEGNCFLKWHYATPTGVPFDEPEAIYYADGSESAGTCHIGIGTDYGGWSTSKSIQLTLLSAMAAGDQLVLSLAANQATDPTAGIAWKVYGAGSTTVKQSGVTSNGTGGTNLGSTSTQGAGYTNGRVNAPQRAVYGYNRWSQSAMRQWLNSEAAAGAWWSKQNSWDRPPAVAETLQGFLKGAPASFLSVLRATPVVTAINTVEGSANATETTNDKIFLPALQQMYINPQLADVEGESWEYFEMLAREAGLSGKFQQSGTYPELITYNIADKASPVAVRLRSAYRGTAGNAWYVDASGSVYSNSASNALRGCPACRIKKSV